METVQFIMDRKAAFAGALLPFHIYINGQLVGTVKNGKTLRADVPKADAYYLEDSGAFGRNAVICDCGLSEYHIVLKRAGGWRTASYNTFYMADGQQLLPLPAFHFKKCAEALYADRIDELPPAERLLALCMEFRVGIADDIQELLASDHLFAILNALQEIGAAQYADALLKIINEHFPDVALPLSDDRLDHMLPRMPEANKLIWKIEPTAWAEFYCAVIKHITNNLDNSKNVY